MASTISIFLLVSNKNVEFSFFMSNASISANRAKICGQNLEFFNNR
jgi:hypothetical protein